MTAATTSVVPAERFIVFVDHSELHFRSCILRAGSLNPLSKSERVVNLENSSYNVDKTW